MCSCVVVGAASVCGCVVRDFGVCWLLLVMFVHGHWSCCWFFWFQMWLLVFVLVLIQYSTNTNIIYIL